MNVLWRTHLLAVFLQVLKSFFSGKCFSVITISKNVYGTSEKYTLNEKAVHAGENENDEIDESAVNIYNRSFLAGVPYPLTLFWFCKPQSPHSRNISLAFYAEYTIMAALKTFTLR